MLRRGDIIRVPSGRRAGMAVVLAPPPAGTLQGPGPTGRSCSPPRASSSSCRRRTSRSPRSRSSGCGCRPGSASGRRSTGGSHLLDAQQLPAWTIPDGDMVTPTATTGAADGAADGAVGDAAELRRKLCRHPCHGCSDRNSTPGTPSATSASAGRSTSSNGRSKPVPRDRPDVRQGLRRARPARVPRRRHGDPRRQAADPPVLRTRPAGRRMPAPRPVGRAEPASSRPASRCCRSSRASQATTSRLRGCRRARSATCSPARTSTGPSRPAREAQRPGGPPRADPGFVWRANGATRRKLEDVLDSVPGLTPGDFVRSVNQLMDLLDQIAGAARGRPRARAPPRWRGRPRGPGHPRLPGRACREPRERGIAATARAAIDAMRRGVVPTRP